MRKRPRLTPFQKIADSIMRRTFDHEYTDVSPEQEYYKNRVRPKSVVRENNK